jgi:branched-chain amino acid transport system substrate-binding protein
MFPARRRARSAFPTTLACATLVGAVMLTAACGGSSSSGSSSSSKSSSGGSALLGPAKAATGTPIKIGWVSDGQTQAIDTTGEIKAAQATAAYANAHLGGLGGHPIDLITCQDKGDPSTAQACGNQFVNAHVSAVAAGSPGQTDPWIKVVAAAKIPVTLSLATTTVVLSTPNVFVFGNPLATFGTPAAFARQSKLTSDAALVIDVPNATGPAKQLLPAFFGNAGATASVTPIPPGTADMTPQVQAAQEKKPAMYSIIGDPTFCSGAIKAIRTLGITAPVLILDRCIGTDKGASIPGGYKGMTVVAQADVDPKNSEFQLFSAVIKAYGPGLTTDGNAVSGYQGMLGLVRAFNASGSTDTSPAGITKAIKAMPPTTYPLGGGADFQCNGKAVSISPNICSTVGFVADAATDGTESNFRTVDATGIYKLPTAG